MWPGLTFQNMHPSCQRDLFTEEHVAQTLANVVSPSSSTSLKLWILYTYKDAYLYVCLSTYLPTFTHIFSWKQAQEMRTQKALFGPLHTTLPKTLCILSLPNKYMCFLIYSEMILSLASLRVLINTNKKIEVKRKNMIKCKAVWKRILCAEYCANRCVRVGRAGTSGLKMSLDRQITGNLWGVHCIILVIMNAITRRMTQSDLYFGRVTVKAASRMDLNTCIGELASTWGCIIRKML